MLNRAKQIITAVHRVLHSCTHRPANEPYHKPKTMTYFTVHQKTGAASQSMGCLLCCSNPNKIITELKVESIKFRQDWTNSFLKTFQSLHDAENDEMAAAAPRKQGWNSNSKKSVKSSVIFVLIYFLVLVLVLVFHFFLVFHLFFSFSFVLVFLIFSF